MSWSGAPTSIRAVVMRNRIIWVTLILVLAGGALWLGRRASRSVAEVYVTQRGPAISAVYGTLKVVASLTMNTRTRSSGLIRFSDAIATNAVPGVAVQRGDLLATIVNEDLDREIAKAETDLAAAEEKQRIGPPTQPQLNTQTALLARIEKLAELQNVPASDVERTRNEVRSLGERVRMEQVEMQRVVTILREQAGVLRDRKTRCLITAPIDGTLTAINSIDGEFVGENSVPFTVATHTMFLEGQINEEDVGLIAPKMKAAVRLYSFAGRDFSATVAQVLPTPNNQRYTVTLTLDEPPSNLLAGMTGEMNIIAGRREQALIIPSRAILAGRVLVVQDGIVKPRVVEIGFRNLERSEIVTGLQEGEHVIVADQDLFQPGQRVRAVTINQ